MIESQFGDGSSDGLVASASSDAESAKETTICPELADAINAGREAEGLDALAWDDSLATIAEERAEELTNDFSHNGARNCAGEVIGKSSSNDAQSWYEGLYSSGTHRKNMMGKSHKKVGTAYCYCNGFYYVVAVFDH